LSEGGYDERRTSEKAGYEPVDVGSDRLWALLVLCGLVFAVAGYFIYGKAKEVAREMEEDPIVATSRILAATNPEVELVEADKDNRRVTFRNTETGEEFTFNYEDVEEGRISFTTDGETASIDFDQEGEEAGRMTITTGEGTTTYRAGAELENQPDWLPIYPGADAEGTYSSETPEMVAGGFTFETSDSLEDVLSFYTSELESAGLQIRSRTTTPEGNMLIASASDESRTATVTASVKNGSIEAMVNFMGKN
jgi:hypothetical protein